MCYAKNPKSLFHDITLSVEDIFLLEPFQIKDLQNHVPKKEFVVLLNAYPTIHRYLVNIYPPINSFIDNLLNEILGENKINPRHNSDLAKICNI